MRQSNIDIIQANTIGPQFPAGVKRRLGSKPNNLPFQEQRLGRRIALVQTVRAMRQ